MTNIEEENIFIKTMCNACFLARKILQLELYRYLIGLLIMVTSIISFSKFVTNVCALFETDL